MKSVPWHVPTKCLGYLAGMSPTLFAMQVIIVCAQLEPASAVSAAAYYRYSVYQGFDEAAPVEIYANAD